MPPYGALPVSSDPDGTPPRRQGTFTGVFLPCVSTIFGVVVFLRLGLIVGEGGVWGALAVVGGGTLVALLSTLSLCALLTDEQSAGRADPLRLLLFGCYCAGAAFYVLGLAAALGGGRWTASGALAVLMLVGRPPRRVQVAVAAVILVAVAASVTMLGADWTGLPASTSHQPGPKKLAFLLGQFFPALTGLVAGCALSTSPDLRAPSESVPRGTLAAVAFAAATYGAIVVVLAGSSHSRAELLTDPFVMMRSSDTEVGIPLVFVGIVFATLSSAWSYTSLARDQVSQTRLATWAPVQALVLVEGGVGGVAPVVTGSFLLYFGAANALCLARRVAWRDAFAPYFTLFSAGTAAAGAALCAVCLIVTATLSTVAYLLATLAAALWWQHRDAAAFLRSFRAADRPRLESVGTGGGGEHASDIERAAVYVRDALKGREAWSHEQDSDEAMRLNNAFHRMRFARRLNTAVFMSISFFQQPSWCYHERCDLAAFPRSGLPVLPVRWSVALELCCLGVFALEMAVKLRYMGRDVYWRDRWHGAQLVLLVAELCALLAASVDPSRTPVFPMIRPLLFVALSRRVRKAFVTLAKVLPSFVDCVLLIALLVLFFGCFGCLLFYGTAEGAAYFSSLPEGMLSLLVLLTTANNPDVMMPAYNAHRAAALFFILFLSIGLFFFMNLVLATIYNSYKRQLEHEVEVFEHSRSSALNAAFDTLDFDKRGVVDGETCRALLVELERPLISMFDYTTSAFCSLHLGGPPADMDRDGFRRLVLSVREVPVRDAAGAVGADAGPSHDDALELAVDAVLLANAVCIVLEVNVIVAGGDPGTWEWVELGFTVVYVVEMLAKMRHWGVQFAASLLNRFDFCVVAALALLTAGRCPWVRLVLMVRLLRCLRILLAVKRFNHIFEIFLTLVPAFATLFGMLGALLVFYAEIGVAAFGGAVYEGNPGLAGTTFADSDYYPINFNDFASGMVTLFTLLVVNNWFVVFDGIVAADGGRKVDRLYFISFYAVAVVMITNLLVAFILEAFFDKWGPDADGEGQGDDGGDDTAADDSSEEDYADEAVLTTADEIEAELAIQRVTARLAAVPPPLRTQLSVDSDLASEAPSPATPTRTLRKQHRRNRSSIYLSNTVLS